MVFLAFRTMNYSMDHHLGRESYLAPVTWDEHGWPVVYRNGTVEETMEASCLPFHRWQEESTIDDFDNPVLKPYWNFLRNPHPKDWSLTERTGYLRLKGSAVSLNDVDSPAFVGRRQQHFNCRIRTKLDFSPTKEGEEAGLTVLMNERHHYEIAIRRSDDGRSIFVRRRIGDLVAEVAHASIPSGIVELQIEADEKEYRFAYAVAGEEAKTLASGAARYLSSEVAGGFTGVYLGMYATGNGKKAEAAADFDYFVYET